jgi:hypothetical protein
MQVFVVESLYCNENATKKVSFRRLVSNTHLWLVLSPYEARLLQAIFLFVRQKEQVSLKLASFFTHQQSQ